MALAARIPASLLLCFVTLAGCGDDTDATSSTGASGGAGSGGDATGGAGGGGGEANEGPTVRLPKTSITREELGILVNDQDPQSVEVGAYYQRVRGIPEGNVIHVSFTPSGSDNLPEAEFATLKAAVDAATPAHIQGYAVTWTFPSRVDCMSLTTALAFGFDLGFCNTVGGCQPTQPTEYFDSDSVSPFTDLGARPAMILPGVDVDAVKALIDRGVAADDTFPTGNGYLVRTTDEARSVRYPQFMTTVDDWAHDGGLSLTYIDNSGGAGLDYIENTDDVLFYFTGLTSVPAIDTITYLPGAIADHLTSFGGSIPPVGQMSILAWIEAGATGSFGTLREPCNYTQKFPRTDVLLPHYFRGETLLEAYWKSVQWPGEGLFVGEPLARPWGRTFVEFEDGTLTIRTTMLDPSKLYELRAADAEDGPYAPVLEGISTDEHRMTTITLEDATAPFYELAPSGG